MKATSFTALETYFKSFKQIHKTYLPTASSNRYRQINYLTTETVATEQKQLQFEGWTLHKNMTVHTV